MDNSSEMKSTQVVNQDLEDGVLDVLNNLMETISMNENKFPSYGYSGDAELQRLKSELDNKEQQNNFIPNDVSSTWDSEPNINLEANCEIEELEMPPLDPVINNLEVNGELEEFEMPELDSEFSSGISSCSDTTNDSNSGSANSFEENNVKEEEHVESVPQAVNFAGLIPGKRDCKFGTNDQFMSESELNKQESSSENDVFDPVTGAKLLPPELKGTFKLRQSNPYEFIIPLIGKAPDWGDCQPLMEFDADLAEQFNQQKLEENGPVPDNAMTYEEYIRKKQARTPEEVKADDDRKELRARRFALYVFFQLEKILLQMQSDEPNEDKIVKYFIRFMRLPVSPLDMIHMPQFVHTVMYLKGCPEFSQRVRDIAKDCFEKIHVLFPIPEGYNFETVYMNEVEKCLPVEWDKMKDHPLWYDWPEDSESENEDSESENEEFEDEEEEVDSGNEDEEVNSENEDGELNSGNEDDVVNSENEDEGNSGNEDEEANFGNANNSLDNANE